MDWIVFKNNPDCQEFAGIYNLWLFLQMHGKKKDIQAKQDELLTHIASCPSCKEKNS